MAEAWFREEYEPVVEMLREAGLCARRAPRPRPTCASSHLRYLLLRTHEWNDEVIERLREELERPSWDEDTMVKALRKELSVWSRAVRR